MTLQFHLSRLTAIQILAEQMEGRYITPEQRTAMSNRKQRWEAMKDEDWPAEWAKVQATRKQIERALA